MCQLGIAGCKSARLNDPRSAGGLCMQHLDLFADLLSGGSVLAPIQGPLSTRIHTQASIIRSVGLSEGQVVPAVARLHALRHDGMHGVLPDDWSTVRPFPLTAIVP